jgi:uncharacterized membrane protein
MPETAAPTTETAFKGPGREGVGVAAGWIIWLVSALAAAAWFTHAAMRWHRFAFTTFDLAFYVQCLWRVVPGDPTAYSTLLDMPMLGNHADVIVLVLVPLFALIPHALTPVAVQTLICGLAGPLGYRTARAAGLEPPTSLALALTLLFTPAMCFAASFEFHPETLTTTFLLLMYYGQVRERRWIFWLGAVLTLSCKENMALLLAAYAVVHGAVELWKTRGAWKMSPILIQSILLIVVCAGWFLGYEKLLRPALNQANVDYGSLYDHLGGSLGAVALSPLTRPAAFFEALGNSLAGDLLWATLLPVAFLPLLRPRWIVIAGPILAQHLLSNRSSEWGVDHHYAAPILALWFAAAVEALVWLRNLRNPQSPFRIPHLAWLLPACAVLTIFLVRLPNKVRLIYQSTFAEGRLSVEKRHELLKDVRPQDRVFIGPPYMSHVAERDGLYSLQLLMKGSVTLGTAPYDPPKDSDFIVIDHQDISIFALIASFFHGPLYYEEDGTRIPGSDTILHNLMRGDRWITTRGVNEWSAYRRLAPGEAEPPNRFMPNLQPGKGVRVAPGSVLHFAEPRKRVLKRGEVLDLGMLWEFPEERDVIPWMWVRLEPATPENPPGLEAKGYRITRGMVLPQGYNNGMLWRDLWQMDPAVWNLPPGTYRLKLGFQDQAAVLASGRQAMKTGRSNAADAYLYSTDLGEIVLE